MSPHDLMVKILELRELEAELQSSCSENCSRCKKVIKKRIDNLIDKIGKDVIENPQQLRNHDMMLRVQELTALENLLCNLCREICGECKEEIKNRMQNLCAMLERNCENCECNSA